MTRKAERPAPAERGPSQVVSRPANDREDSPAWHTQQRPLRIASMMRALTGALAVAKAHNRMELTRWDASCLLLGHAREAGFVGGAKRVIAGDALAGTLR